MMYVWFTVIIAAIIIELATPSALITIWFSIGGAIAALLAAFGVNTIIQIIVFAIVSTLSLFTIRPIAAKYLRGNVVPTNADRCIGEIGIVTKAISNNRWGEVFVNTTYWSAVELNGKCVDVDKKVKVIAIEGAKVIVIEVE